MTIQYITRKGSFDSAHRVMNERFKCFNIHGHTYLFELTFIFNRLKEIGYAIDFKEIKRIGSHWIEDMLDHGLILNPKDDALIQATKTINSRFWMMSLHGVDSYCNPTVENISKEIFLAMEILFEKMLHLNIHQVRLYETPNCYTDCFRESINMDERNNFLNVRKLELQLYAESKGIIEYDDRNVTA
jgi:6-pyruvoyltetrahydropterin/6-carboxytetrahydropterin synthase